MQRYMVHGADRRTGAEMKRIFDGPDEASAREQAADHGMLVSSVRCLARNDVAFLEASWLPNARDIGVVFSSVMLFAFFVAVCGGLMSGSVEPEEPRTSADLRRERPAWTTVERGEMIRDGLTLVDMQLRRLDSDKTGVLFAPALTLKNLTGSTIWALDGKVVFFDKTDRRIGSGRFTIYGVDAGTNLYADQMRVSRRIADQFVRWELRFRRL